MPRDPRKVEKRVIEPDAKYKSVLVSQFINKTMLDGKKSVSTKLVYKAFDNIQEAMKTDPLEVFEAAVKNVSPQVQIKSRRIGGATYQVPIEVKGNRKIHYALSWIRDAARAKSGKSYDKCLAEEIMDAYNSTGTAFKKKEDTHRMAEANKAFAHFARY
ncbi:30S ribosomal protein S7 [candidate division WS5 bacterium]|uniref:Small ribosomal subunit protein uS7 n=1 Tax=candidate division WS5 bacterium TaxID=2093353 RepID=A0A419DAB3_9BACT|nr:MAG: 30S ribosomal protein S7 [candidate division WS5 bacterium]